MRNQKYYLTIAKPAALLPNILPSYNGGKHFLNYFSNFQSDKILKKHEKSFKDHDQSEIKMRKKFQIVFNKDIDKYQQVTANIIIQ